MKVLIIKMSSLGDIIHSLPALTEAAQSLSGIQFDWVVEESFQAIPLMHPSVRRVIPIAFRRWKRGFLKALTSGEIFAFLRQLRAEKYDYVIDAQGLLKSAFVGLFTRRKKFVGFDRNSIRESFASVFYGEKICVSWELQAITRVRMLLAKTLGYLNSETPIGAGISAKPFSLIQSPSLVFLHGTTWESKHWPVAYWIELGQRLCEKGFHLYLPWGNQAEKERAEHIAKAIPRAVVLEKLSLFEIASVLSSASYVVGVDTGLSHLAAALNRPGIFLFGPTSCELNGGLGTDQIWLQSTYPCSPCFKKTCPLLPLNGIHPPCFESLSPEKIMTLFEEMATRVNP